MKLLDILTAPWAIDPAKLLEIQAIYATHLRGDKIDIASVEAKIGRPLNSQQLRYFIQDGVAILPIEGVIAKRMNLFSSISSGSSSELIARDLRDIMNDPVAHSVILLIDSPGGTVDGTQLLADVVSDAEKPVVALASGTMASAAYWIGSAAKAVYIADGTTAVGSIGVVATHTDVSKAEEARGVKTTEIFAGQYKRIASNYAPLSKEGRQTMQDQVDYTYSLFVSAVAKHRGVSTDTVLEKMADGRIFIGQQAIDAGLVDGVSTLDDLVVKLNRDRESGLSRAGVARSIQPKKQGAEMPHPTAEQIAAEHPDIAEHFRAEGATAERARVQAVEGQLIPGHEALINSMKFDGKSTAGDAAQAVLAAEKYTRAVQAAKLASDAPQPVTQTPPPAVEDKQLTRAELDAQAKAYMAAHPGTDYITAVKLIEGGK